MMVKDSQTPLGAPFSALAGPPRHDILRRSCQDTISAALPRPWKEAGDAP
jgi:hypothetical protein